MKCEERDGPCYSICDYNEKNDYSCVGVSREVALDESFYELNVMRIEL